MKNRIARPTCFTSITPNTYHLNSAIPSRRHLVSSQSIYRTMATQTTSQSNDSYLASLAGKVLLTPSTTGVYHVPKITPESAKAASDLLQENHVRNHVFFNQSGFHNHISASIFLRHKARIGH